MKLHDWIVYYEEKHPNFYELPDSHPDRLALVALTRKNGKEKDDKNSDRSKRREKIDSFIAENNGLLNDREIGEQLGYVESYISKRRRQLGLPKAKSKRSVPVDLYDKTGTYLKTFPSVARAMKELKLSRRVINDCCEGVRISYKGFRFKYKSGGTDDGTV